MPKIKVHFEHTLHFIKEMEITQEELEYLQKYCGHDLSLQNYIMLNDIDDHLSSKFNNMINDTEMDEAEDCTIENEEVFIEEVK